MSLNASKVIKSARSHSTDRALSVLTCFTAAQPHLKLSEIAELLKLSPSTIYRYLVALVDAGFLQRDERNGGYRLSWRIIELGGIALSQTDVYRYSVDEMDHLRDETGLLVNLGILVDEDVMHIAHSAPENVPRSNTELGRRSIAHCTALGKALLAYRPWKEVKALIESNGWRSYTQNSIRDFDSLKTEFEKVIKQGFAEDNEERRIGLTCLATPLRDNNGNVVAAISISDLTNKMTGEYRSAILASLLRVADRITNRLGFFGTVTLSELAQTQAKIHEGDGTIDGV